MAKRRITVASALESLEKARDSKPKGYRYNEIDDDGVGTRKCRYFESDGSPSCIVGHVLADHGYTFDPESFRNKVNVIGIRSIVITSDAVAYGLLDAQVTQDQGETWEQAVEVFKYRVAR